MRSAIMSDVPINQELPIVPPPLGASWQEQDVVLRDLWMQNKTPQQISEALGRSVPAIMTRAVRLGLPRRSAPGRKPGTGATRHLPSAASGAILEKRRAVSSGASDLDASAEAKPQLSLRVCLMCLRKFESAGRHNRICSTCKGSAEYGLASALPDVQLPQS
jgi:hypothetical protein